MPRLSEGPNRAFPTLTTVIQQSDTPPIGGEKSVLTIKIPDGDDSLASLATRNVDTSVNLKVTEIQADIPRGCTGRIQLDGREYHLSTDEEGSVGVLYLGDIAAGLGAKTNRITAQFVNPSSGKTLNVRYWVVGFV